MKTIILFFITLFGCVDSEIEYKKPISELEACSRSFVEHIAVSNYDLFAEIYGEYVPMDTLPEESILISREGEYFHVASKQIVSHGQLSVFRDGFNLTFIPSKKEDLIEGVFLYCDETLANKTLNLKFCLLCKCEL